MLVTIGSLFRQIVKALRIKEDNPNSYLNNPKSDLNNQNSSINNSSNNQHNKELRRNVLRELIRMYLSGCLSSEQAEQIVTEYIPLDATGSFKVTQCLAAHVLKFKRF